MSKKLKCPKCSKENVSTRYFCKECGAILDSSMFPDENVTHFREYRANTS